MTQSPPTASYTTNIPIPLDSRRLVECARARGLMLALDYDGTLADITADPAHATPYPGVREELSRLISARASLVIAIVTGRRLTEVQRLLGITRGLYFSGLHGLERQTSDGRFEFPLEPADCGPELDKLRVWLRDNVPRDRGFWIEDKQLTVGLHYRLAIPEEAAGLSAKLEEFARVETPRLKLIRLKMLIEAMPKAASKGAALSTLRRELANSYPTAYFGDDRTDEDAFAVLGGDDFGVLVGSPRPTRARYRIDSPAAMVELLRVLGDALV
jgi:trehalose 6-phosphate phosphatase